MSALDDAVETVKRAVRAQGSRIVWPQPGIMERLKERDETKAAVAELPILALPTHPYYADIDSGQSGIVFGAHLTDEQMLGVPLRIVEEVLDDLSTNAAVAHWGAEPQRLRDLVLESYGPALADLVCQAIDEALESRSEGCKRLKNYDGSKSAPLDSTELDEPYYENCAAEDEHASPTTSFDFWDAVEAARELIEQRDRAAAAARAGEPVDQALAA